MPHLCRPTAVERPQKKHKKKLSPGKPPHAANGRVAAVRAAGSGRRKVAALLPKQQEAPQGGESFATSSHTNPASAHFNARLADPDARQRSATRRARQAAQRPVRAGGTARQQLHSPLLPGAPPTCLVQSSRGRLSGVLRERVESYSSSGRQQAPVAFTTRAIRSGISSRLHELASWSRPAAAAPGTARPRRAEAGGQPPSRDRPARATAIPIRRQIRRRVRWAARGQ
jgi:hypothetical protein